MHDDRYYPSESILVHEFAHAVMNIGMDEPEKDAVHQAWPPASRPCDVQLKTRNSGENLCALASLACQET